MLTLAMLSIFMFSFSNYDAQKDFRLRLRQASRSIKRFSHLCVEGASIKEIHSTQDDSAVHRHRQIIHSGSDDHGIKGAGVGLMDPSQVESVQLATESVHVQHPPPPQQHHHESQESTSPWRSWKRSHASMCQCHCRSTHDQERNQEEINQQLSHH